MSHAAATPARPWWVLFVVCLAESMVVIDETITNVALPSIQADLGISTSDLQWVVNSYMLAFGGLLLLGGRMADLLGRRRILVLGAVCFALASLANGLAWSPEVLIVFRGLQGAGAALIAPAALSVIMTCFTDGPQRTRAMSVWSAITSGGAAVGLLLGGVVTQLVSWPWIFFINVPVGIVVVVAAYRWVPETYAQLGHRRFDVAGALSVTAGLMLLVYAIVGSVDHDLLGARTLVLLGVSLALLCAFVLIELRSPAPLMRLGLLRLRSLAGANLVMLLVSAGMFAFFYFATLYTQLVLGFGPIEAGVAFLPFTLGILVGTGVAQASIARVGVRGVSAAGLVGAAGGLAWMAAALSVDGSIPALLGGMLLMSTGLGICFVPLTLIATTNVADDEAGLASGIYNTTWQVGGAVGLAVLSTVANAVTQGRGARAESLRAMVDGYQVAMAAGVGLILAGLLAQMLLVRRCDVAGIDRVSERIQPEDP